jgi:hypothetical protein
MSSDIGAVTYESGVAVTQSDTAADPAGPFCAFFTGAGGTVKYTDMRGKTVVLTGVAAGVIFPVAFTRIWTSVTTATGLVGFLARPYQGPNA